MPHTPAVIEHDKRNWALLALLGMIWGSSFLGVEIAIRDLPPITVAASRITIAATILVSLAHLLGHGLPRGARRWAYAAGAGLLSNAAPFSLLSWGQQTVSSGLAGMFMAAIPLIVLPLSHFLTPNDRMTFRKTIGFAIGFCGVVLLIGPGALQELGGSAREAWAQLACFGAGMCYASSTIVAKRAPPTHPVSFAAAAMMLAAMMLIPLALVVERPWTATPGAASLIAVALLGVFPTALAMFLLLRILQSATPPFLSLVNYQVPVWAVFLGAVVLGERVEARAGVALALILFGLAISQNLIFRRTFHRT